MKKYTKYFVTTIGIMLTLVACNNDDDQGTFATVEDAVASTTIDVDNFLNTFTINDKQLFTANILNEGIYENDINFIKLDANGEVPDDQKVNTSQIKLIDLLNENTARGAGFPFALQRGSIDVTSTLKQDYYYMVLKEGNGKRVLKSDPSYLVTNASSLTSAINENTSALNFEGRPDKDEDRLAAWSSLTNGGFTAFDTVLSKMKSGTQDTSCLSPQDPKQIAQNSGVGFIIVPQTLVEASPTGNSIDAIVITFTIVNTQRIDVDADGILTLDEVTIDEENNSVSYFDSDKDGIEDYRDFDDDGDGIPTLQEIRTDKAITDSDLNEDADCDGDTTNDYRLDPEFDGIPNYLDPNIPNIK